MIYPYRCSICNKEKEVERSIHDDAIAPMCDDCNLAMERIWSAPPIKFNAPGFYSTGN